MWTTLPTHPRGTTRLGPRLSLIVLVVAGVVASSVGAAPSAQRVGAPEHRIVAENFAFHPSRIVVNAGDAVRVTFVAKDRAYTFTIDAYRISRRATPGHDVVIEFCADQVGTFVFYCNLTDDARCRGMKGELVVR